MFWYGQDEEGNKDREVYIGRNYFRIEIVCLDGMDDGDHDKNPDYSPESCESIGDDDDRYSWDDRPEYRDESEYKNDEGEGDDIGKIPSAMHEADDDESDGSEYRVHECDDRLSTEYHPESCTDLACDDRVLFVEKCEIPITHLSQECFDLFSLDDENIGEDQSEEKFQEDESTARDIVQSKLSDRFEIRRTKYLFCCFLETEIDRGTLLDLRDEFLTADSDLWSSRDEFLDIETDFRNDIDKDKCHYRNKEDIENRDNDIGRCVFRREFMPGITFSFLTPAMDPESNHLSCFEKYIGTDKYDKKECEKIEKEPYDEWECTPGNEFLEKFLWEDEGEEDFEHNKENKSMSLENFIDIQCWSNALLESTFDRPGSCKESSEGFDDEVFYFWSIDSSVVPGFLEDECECCSFDLESSWLNICHEGRIFFSEMIDEEREGKDLGSGLEGWRVGRLESWLDGWF